MTVNLIPSYDPQATRCNARSLVRFGAETLALFGAIAIVLSGGGSILLGAIQILCAGYLVGRAVRALGA